ncbi:hypothetical protein HPB52_018016 [Rhipicephalus sanguineus]|uniref:Peptidase aspartic putative domain-containing protein n=1 Tax=Rhipicephalus sanguineus TaxID=34632 RepID=A0A9D4T2W2_RHISA|nr:hypothetical protein HPB52_018016 [Rhipicephalus sanguineus]
MERLVKKRRVIRAQITRLINDYENRPQPLDENEAAILHTRLTSWHNELNTVNDEIEPLVTDEDAENEFQQTCEYKDRVVACLARLQRRMTRAMPRDILLDFGRKCATDANSTFDDQRSSSTEGSEPTTPEGDRGHQEERPFRKVKVFLETKRGEKREFEVLETDVICDQTIPKPPKETLEKLEALGYECADSNDHGPKDIGLLIGADYLWDLTTGRTVKLGKRLRAVETAAGWTVQGPVEGSNNDGHCAQTVMLRTSVIEMTSDTPSKHWTLESIDVIERNETTSTALEFFESTLSMATRKDFECGALSTTELNRAELFWAKRSSLAQLTEREKEKSREPECSNERNAVA